MSGGDEPVKINPADVVQSAQSASGVLGQAAAPGGPIPYGTGGSPIDGATSAASGTVIATVAAASGDLAPRGGEVVGAADTAVAGLQTADSENVNGMEAVGQQAQTQLRVPPDAAPGSVAQGGLGSELTGGLGEVEQAASSAGSVLGAPLGAVGQLGELPSAASGLSGAPMESLTQQRAELPQGHESPPATSQLADTHSAAPPEPA